MSDEPKVYGVKSNAARAALKAGMTRADVVAVDGGWIVSPVKCALLETPAASAVVDASAGVDVSGGTIDDVPGFLRAEHPNSAPEDAEVVGVIDINIARDGTLSTVTHAAITEVTDKVAEKIVTKRRSSADQEGADSAKRKAKATARAERQAAAAASRESIKAVKAAAKAAKTAPSGTAAVKERLNARLAKAVKPAKAAAPAKAAGTRGSPDSPAAKRRELLIKMLREGWRTVDELMAATYPLQHVLRSRIATTTRNLKLKVELKRDGKVTSYRIAPTA